jgi:hypothetical protein
MNELSLQYPPPPPFYVSYTDENIEQFKKDKEITGGSSFNQDGELRLDPPAPVAGEYSLFGEMQSVCVRAHLKLIGSVATILF